MSRLRDLAHRHADVGARALDVDLARARQRRDGGVIDVRVACEELGRWRSWRAPRDEAARRSGGEMRTTLPYAGITRIRFQGSVSPARDARTGPLAFERHVTPKRRSRPIACACSVPRWHPPRVRARPGLAPSAAAEASSTKSAAAEAVTATPSGLAGLNGLTANYVTLLHHCARRYTDCVRAGRNVLPETPMHTHSGAAVTS